MANGADFFCPVRDREDRPLLLSPQPHVPRYLLPLPMLCLLLATKSAFMPLQTDLLARLLLWLSPLHLLRLSSHIQCSAPHPLGIFLFMTVPLIYDAKHEEIDKVFVDPEG